MPTLRPTRRRSRKPKGFTAAQMQLLTGRRQGGVNRFEWGHLLSFGFDPSAIEALLDRAAGVVPGARLAELRAWLDACGRRPRGECRPLPPMSREYCEQAEADCKSQYDSSPGMQELGGSWRDYYRFHPVSGAA